MQIIFIKKQLHQSVKQLELFVNSRGPETQKHIRRKHHDTVTAGTIKHNDLKSSGEPNVEHILSGGINIGAC
jgi:hypothetical protein